MLFSLFRLSVVIFSASPFFSPLPPPLMLRDGILFLSLSRCRSIPDVPPFFLADSLPLRLRQIVYTVSV